MAALGLLLRALVLLLPALGLLLAALGELLATLYLAPRREGRYVGSACVRAVRFQSARVRFQSARVHTTRCQRGGGFSTPPHLTNHPLPLESTILPILDSSIIGLLDSSRAELGWAGLS